jgi:hypothetical protein
MAIVSQGRNQLQGPIAVPCDYLQALPDEALNT